MNWSITEDILPWLGFTAAVVAILLVPVRRRGAFSAGAKWFFAASVGCYMIGTVWSIVGHFAVRPEFASTIVDGIEELLVPFLLFGIYSLYARQQLNDALSSEDAFRRTSEMMQSVVATAPAGIVVLDDAGRITFANDAARVLLDVRDDPDRVSMASPGWTVRMGEGKAMGAPATDFRCLLGDERITDAVVMVEWPNGWRRRLQANCEPTKAADGTVTGAIVAFLEHEPWRVVPHEERRNVVEAS